MRRLSVAVAVLAALALAYSVAAADARSDLRIREEVTKERDRVWNLVNIGDRTVRAKVELRKTCNGIANTRKPSIREYWVQPKQKVRLGKAWSDSTCRRRYTVVEAKYH